MSKVTQIQQALRSVDQGTFQYVCDALLHAKGYGQITQIGSVVGAYKVAPGTPDTRVALPDGQFVFAEYTTQQEGTYSKLRDDLRKCFDETISGVPTSRIREVILCHNTKLKTGDEAALFDECKKHNVKCSIWGLERRSV